MGLSLSWYLCFYVPVKPALPFREYVSVARNLYKPTPESVEGTQNKTSEQSADAELPSEDVTNMHEERNNTFVCVWFTLGGSDDVLIIPSKCSPYRAGKNEVRKGNPNMLV